MIAAVGAMIDEAIDRLMADLHGKRIERQSAGISVQAIVPSQGVARSCRLARQPETRIGASSLPGPMLRMNGFIGLGSLCVASRSATDHISCVSGIPLSRSSDCPAALGEKLAPTAKPS